MAGKCISAGAIAVKALKAQVRAARKTVDGVGNGAPDAIHDMRVASRRLRAVLTELGNVFDADAARKFLKKTKRITRKLGRARELDVSLAILEGVKKRLRGAPRLAANHVAQFLQAERKTQDANVAKAADIVNAPKFARTLDHLTATVSNKDNGCIEQAVKSTSRRYKNVLKAYRKWLSAPSPVLLHKLRIAFKKLRYSCETYQPLYGKPMDDFIKSLKHAQESLGDWHDYCILGDYITQATAAATQNTKEGMTELSARVNQKAAQFLQTFTNDSAIFFNESHQQKAQELCSATQHNPTHP